MRLRLSLPALEESVQATIPQSCPNPKRRCWGQTFQRFGTPPKHVRDVHRDTVQVQRWRCTTCGCVFRVYPLGVTRRQQTQRLQALSILFWVLGMSLGGVSDALGALGVKLGRSTVYGNIQRGGTVARRKLRERLRGKITVQVVAVDATHVKEQGRDKVVLQTVDAQSGVTVEITTVPGEDERTIARYVQRIAKLTGCAVLVSADADAFKTAADAAGLKHQICQQHVVPNTLTLLSDIAEQLDQLPPGSTGPQDITPEVALEDLAEVEEIILARAPGSQARLDALRQRYQAAVGPAKGRRASPWYRLRLLTLDLAEDWSRLTLTEHHRAPDGARLVPPTNNVTERAMGLNIKDRYRTMRGYKSTVSLRRTPSLTAYLRDHASAAVWNELLMT